MDDATLMAGLSSGDEGALAAIYDRHAPRALAVARRVLPDADDAQDVVQEVFVALWREPSRYDAGRGGLAAWLARWTHNRAIDRRRSAAARERAAERAGESQARFAQAPGRPDSGLAGAIDQLPPEQREPLELAYYEGLTQSEIAERLGAPLGTVKSRLRLALDRLRVAYRGAR